MSSNQGKPHPDRMPEDRSSRQIMLGFFIAMFMSFPVQAEQVLSMALGAIEEGDERYRPEWIGRCLIKNTTLVELHYYGRSQGRVRQSTLMLTTTYNYPLLASKLFSARIGGALSRDQTVIRSSDPDVATLSRDAYNLGPYLGLGMKLGGKIVGTLDWNNAQFLAGSAGILLATARKQSISLGVGWTL